MLTPLQSVAAGELREWALTCALFWGWRGTNIRTEQPSSFQNTCSFTNLTDMQLRCAWGSMQCFQNAGDQHALFNHSYPKSPISAAFAFLFIIGPQGSQNFLKSKQGNKHNTSILFLRAPSSKEKSALYSGGNCRPPEPQTAAWTVYN